MGHFLKPTKVTWIVFILLVIINIAGPFSVQFFSNVSPFVNWLTFDLPIYQFLGLWDWVADMGINVIAPSGAEFFDAPNMLGWVLIIVPFLITLMFHYLIASVISKWYYRRNILNSKF